MWFWFVVFVVVRLVGIVLIFGLMVLVVVVDWFVVGGLYVLVVVGFFCWGRVVVFFVGRLEFK